MKWIRKNKIHIFIWGIFIAYLLFANQLYTTFFMKSGKPLDGPVALPAQSGKIVMNVDGLNPTNFEGQDLYVLYGWVFAPDVAGSADCKKKLVLHSADDDLVFEMSSIAREDLNKALPQYQMDLTNGGFEVLIAKETLNINNYKMGFLLEDEQGRVCAFQMVDKYIQREPNKLRFVGGS